MFLFKCCTRKHRPKEMAEEEAKDAQVFSIISRIDPIFFGVILLLYSI